MSSRGEPFGNWVGCEKSMALPMNQEVFTIEYLPYSTMLKKNFGLSLSYHTMKLAFCGWKPTSFFLER